MELRFSKSADRPRRRRRPRHSRPRCRADHRDGGRKTAGTYVAGDFHNHTTCSDGSISMQKLVKKATDKVDTPWGLDWFVQAGHGGNGNRNCTLVEDATLATPAYPFDRRPGPDTPPGRTRGVDAEGRRLGHQPEPQHVALAVDPGVPVPADRVPERLQEPAAVPRHRVGRRRPRALLDVGHHRPDPGGARHATLPTRPTRRRRLHAARQRARAGAVGVLLRPRRHRHQPRQPDRHGDRQQLGLLGPRQRQRGRSELERDGAEADPGRRRRHRHQGPPRRRSRR